MGAVELVIQVESPPAVASGLQRIGRAGHVVGATSHGSFYPKHRADLLQTTVVVQKMVEGGIEKLHIPTNPLDVLAQRSEERRVGKECGSRQPPGPKKKRKVPQRRYT